MLLTAKLNATGHRWVAELADFDLTIKYRPGRENGDADGLSRMPCDIVMMIGLYSEEMSSPSVQTTVQAAELNVSHTQCGLCWLRSVRERMEICLYPFREQLSVKLREIIKILAQLSPANSQMRSLWDSSLNHSE